MQTISLSPERAIELARPTPAYLCRQAPRKRHSHEADPGDYDDVTDDDGVAVVVDDEIRKLFTNYRERGISNKQLNKHRSGRRPVWRRTDDDRHCCHLASFVFFGQDTSLGLL